MMESDCGYAQDTTDQKPLAGLAGIADEAERTSALLASFIVRFRHGDLPPATGSAAQLKPVPSGHAGQIERIRDAVFDLNRLARDLNTLG